MFPSDGTGGHLSLLGAAITFPNLCADGFGALFLSQRNYKRKPNFSDRLMSWFQNAFNPVIAFALRRKLSVRYRHLLVHFQPAPVYPIGRGSHTPAGSCSRRYNPAGSWLSHTVEMVEKANKILLNDNFPEIKHTVRQWKRAIISSPSKGHQSNCTTHKELVEKMEEKLVLLAGVKFEFHKTHFNQFNEFMSGRARMSQDKDIRR